MESCVCTSKDANTDAHLGQALLQPGNNNGHLFGVGTVLHLNHFIPAKQHEQPQQQWGDVAHAR